MPEFLARVNDGIERAVANVELAAVPLLLAVIAVDDIGAVLGFTGGHFGIRFGFPTGVLDPWHFVDVPTAGSVSVRTGSLVVAAVGIVLRGVLGAGYFASLRDLLVDGEYDFAAGVERYVAQFLALAAIPAVALLVLSAVALGPGGAVLVVLAIPAYLAVAYLFFATPYLVVLRDTDLVSAARASYGLAVEGGPYASYAIGYLVLLMAVSAVATGVVVNLGLLGLVLGIPALSVVGLGLNVATMRFVADVDDASPSAGRWPDDRPGPRGEAGDDPRRPDDDVAYGIDGGERTDD